MKEPLFSEHFICNFNGAVREEDLLNDALKQLWFTPITVEQLEGPIQNWLSFDRNTLNDPEVAVQLLKECVRMILTFVQQNFTGPFTQVSACKDILNRLKLGAQYDPFEQLKASGEEINPNVKNGELLVVAKEMLQTLRQTFPNQVVLAWWHLRLVCIHQHIVDDLTDELYQQFKQQAESLLLKVEEFKDKELQGLLYLEIGNGYLQFHRSSIASDIIDQMCKKFKVTLNVAGLLGVRTRYQQKALPQLCLRVTQSDSNTLPPADITNGQTTLPKLLTLDDDTRLERIRFIEPEDNEIMTLPSIFQSLVLAKVRQLKRSQPKDRLADEELEPYTQTLLYQTNGPLQVRHSALLLNCVQESGNRRTVERSWKQCEEAVKLLDNAEQYTLQERLSYGFASFLLPKWHVQMQLCELLRSLGMTKSALDIYLKIQSWQNVIDCYTSLELRHKAAEIIRQELDKKPTAMLYCLLGDAEDDPKYYEQAWEFSKHTSGKAQAYWGNYHFRRHEYDKALEHLEKSIEINMLQEKILLRYGYSAIQLERWETAVHAYISYTHLEPNGFESWNNLAKALIKLGDKPRAHKVLAESLKCNFNNWKVWENFMLVSVDTGNLDDAIRAYNRLSEIKDRFQDLEVLSIIVHGVAKASLEAKEETKLLLKHTVSLMGQQCIKHGNESLVWELAALVAPTPLKKAEKLVKSYRALTSKDANWYTTPEYAVKVLKICNEMCDLSLAAMDEHADDESESMITSQLNSARLSANSCLNALKRATNVESTLEQDELLQSLNIVVSKLLETVQKRMA